MFKGVRDQRLQARRQHLELPERRCGGQKLSHKIGRTLSDDELSDMSRVAMLSLIRERWIAVVGRHGIDQVIVGHNARDEDLLDRHRLSTVPASDE